MSGVLTKDYKTNGVIFKAKVRKNSEENEGGDSDIDFYENGNVEFGYLAEDQTINGVIFKAGIQL